MPIENFTRTLDFWVIELNKFNLCQLLIKPDEKSWSLGQLYEHLIEETHWYNGQIKISLTDKENSKAETTPEAQLLFKSGSFADKRIKGDPLIAENVKQPPSIDQLKKDFEKLKQETNEIWKKMNSVTSYGKSEHPGIGFLNGFEWLQYSEMHLRHHLKQKARIETFLKQNG